jgi:hypothetical protein
MYINWPCSFREGKYSKTYCLLMNKATQRANLTGYTERHHIVPRSFGGTNHASNLVVLTAREHYIAHALLWKMNFEGKYGQKMSYAFNTFISKMQASNHKNYNNNHNSYKINSRVFESFRKHYAALMSEQMTGTGNYFYGKKHSEETKRLIGEKSKQKIFKRGPENPQWGKKRTLSAAEFKIRSENLKACWANPDWKANMLEKRRIANNTPEAIANRSAAAARRVGVKRDPAIVEKTASKMRGKKAHEIFSPEALTNIAAARKNRKYTPEAKAKLASIARAMGSRPKSEEFKKMISSVMTGIVRPTKVCEHCGKECVVANYNRWHSNNCKHKK